MFLKINNCRQINRCYNVIRKRSAILELLTRIKKHSLERLCFFMFKKLIQKIHDIKKWKLYLFYDGALIKKIKLRNNDFQNKPIYITIVGHKDKFGKFIVGRMVVPVRLLKTDENKKITYWGVIDEIGVEVE